MELTQEILSQFVGGQLEWQNQEEGWLYRGQIANVQIKVTVNFEWVAELKKTEGWIEADRNSVTFDTMLCRANWLGDGPGDNRLVIVNETGELGVFFPLGGSKLDRARVQPREV